MELVSELMLNQVFTEQKNQLSSCRNTTRLATRHILDLAP